MLMLAAVVVASAGLYGCVASGSPLPIYFVTYPAAIFALGLLQLARPTLGISFKVIGDITYSTYLIHFPLQLLALLTIKSCGLTVDFSQPLPFVAFLVAVIGLAIPTFYLFEVPAQSWVRRRLLQPSVRTSEAGALAQPGALPR